MIKLTKHIYVHILTFVLIAVCVFLGKAYELLSVYGVMLLHELAHLFAAVCIGLKISHMTLYPFGVNLKLKNKLVCSIADEIILYSAGPLVNAVAALLVAFLYAHTPSYKLQYLYISNIMLFITNLIPATPLDGGIILKKLLVYKLGTRSAQIIIRCISAVFAALFLVAGVYAVYVTGYNFSILLMSVLLIGNLFTQKEKYNLDYVKELMFYKNKNRNRVEWKVFNEKKSLPEISRSFDYGKYNIVLLTDDDGKIANILTETEIINKIIH